MVSDGRVSSKAKKGKVFERAKKSKSGVTDCSALIEIELLKLNQLLEVDINCSMQSKKARERS